MEKKYLDEYKKHGIDIVETQEKLNIPAVKQRFIDRKEKLLRDQEYYSMCVNGGAKFNPHIKYYVNTIPNRIEELDYIIKNIV
jgi:hypothetical protein